MSNLSDIMGGIQSVLQNATNGVTLTKPALKAYQFLPDAVNHTPAALIVPDGLALDPEQAFGGNSFKFRFRIVVLVSSIDPETGWTQLTEMMDPTQTNKSIIKAIRADPTLNGKADTSDIIAIENFGRRNYGEISFFGFDAILEGFKSVA